MGGVGSGTGAVVAVDRMWDCKAATVTINDEPLGKVRVLWHAGALRCYNVAGLALNVLTTVPKRKPFRVSLWQTTTTDGRVITIRGACWTCGGWAKIAVIPAEKLWAKP